MASPVECFDAAAGFRWFVKRDDLGGGPLGGSKVRKLEFIFGKARHASARAVLTSGAADSNHVLATALYAPSAGFTAGCVVTPAPPSANAAALAASGAAIFDCPFALRSERGREVLRRASAHLETRCCAPPFVIPFAGAGVAGVLGHVNAALELAEQVRTGTLPVPDRIYVALASAGTAAGLALGCALAGLRSLVVGVRVVERESASEALAKSLIERANRALRECDASVPLVDSSARIVLDHGFAGEGYRCPAPYSTEAERIAAAAGLTLEPAYTIKALAALYCHVRDGSLERENVLFWNTSGRPVSELAAQNPAAAV